MGEASGGRPATLADYQAVFLRRKWIIIGLTLVAALTSYTLTARQSPLYQAKAQVRINTTNIVAAVTGVSTGTAFGDPTRFLATQANVARDRKLAELVVEKAGIPGMTTGKFLGESGAAPQTDADVLDLGVTDPSAGTATRLATTYAEQFKAYAIDLQTAEINNTLAAVEKQLGPLRAAGDTTSPKFQELSTQESLLIAVGKGLAGNISASPAGEPRRSDLARSVPPSSAACWASLWGLVSRSSPRLSTRASGRKGKSRRHSAFRSSGAYHDRRVAWKTRTSSSCSKSPWVWMPRHSGDCGQVSSSSTPCRKRG